ncbi:S-layer homology domain-containing protein [Leptolyngbya ohadii]|uniref:S-layer homology domain-containing protein n=1 Tax=Leptolyngbya ohadii TaxID=1962290 RepID=UPI000B598EBD|nr:S-layer homology domain-containing protein [Leptolyngbya ohadii]
MQSNQVAPSFSDITTHWAKACILAIAERRILNGYPDGTFRPNNSLSRAEFAVILPIVFPNAQPVRDPVDFSDVPADHWAYKGIRQAYANGWFSGYADGTFQPNQPITRPQVMAVLATALHFEPPANPMDILKLYFEDADQIPDWTRWTIAAGVQQDIVISYPSVRRFYPAQNASRGEIAAILCRVLQLVDVVPLDYSTRGLGVYDLKDSVTVVFPQWRGSARLMRDTQVLLSEFQLYPANQINGQYNSQMEQGLTTFCNFYGLSTMKTGVMDREFGWTMTHADPIDYFLAQAKDRKAIYQEFLAKEAGFDQNKLAFLDRGAATSPYYKDLAQFPDRLAQKPDGKTIVSLGESLVLTGTDKRVYFNPFPVRGVLPAIDSVGLNFLDPDIKEACLCVGSFVNGAMHTHWSGRKALDNVQLWSTTKIIPLINAVCQANAANPSAKVRDCLVRPVGSKSGYGFYNLAVDLVSYQGAIATSNAVSATFKQFFTPKGLENWFKNLTGNRYLEFVGRYGEPPFIQNPELWNQPTNKVVLPPAYSDHTGNNAISTCDMARFIAMLGWHHHLPETARLPSAQWSSLETVVRAMGTDTARYIDVAIDRLKVGSIIQSPVILSKLGFGRSSARDRTELCYVALVWFVDARHSPVRGNRSPVRQGKPAVLRTFSLALRAAKDLNDANEEARQLDAKVAADVTEILRRILTQELA